MVRITQTIEAAYEVESTYGSPPGSNLYHLGLLDTFDPRAVEMNITPVPSIGQSTDAHHASGPIDVTLPLKVALQGDGWKELLGSAIGRTHIDNDETSTGSGAVGADGIDAVHSLTTDVYSHAILAKDLSTTQHTLCTGVVVNEATLEADYTAGGYMTLDCACTALYSEDDDDGDFTFDATGSGAMTYNSLPFPSPPTSDPLLPTDLTLSYSTATVDGIRLNDTAGNYVEVGERYMRFFTEDDALDSGYGASGPIVSTGVIDLDHSDYDSGSRMTTLKVDIDAISGVTCTENSSTTDPQNLIKGIYKLTAGSATNIPAVASTTQTLTEFSIIKTVSLKVANNNTSIPGKVDGKWVLAIPLEPANRHYAEYLKWVETEYCS